MKKRFIAVTAVGAAILIAGAACLIAGGLNHVHSVEATKAKVAADKALVLSHMKHWHEYERLMLKPANALQTDAERAAASADSAAAGNAYLDASAQWITTAEAKKVAPILFKGGVIKSVKAVDDPIIYRWSVLSLATICQSVFDGKTDASTITTVATGKDKNAAIEAKLTNANNAAVQVICPELF